MCLEYSRVYPNEEKYLGVFPYSSRVYPNERKCLGVFPYSSDGC